MEERMSEAEAKYLDVKRLWETFVRVPRFYHWEHYMAMVQTQLTPLVLEFRDMGIGWWCFLCHDRNSGVPTDEEGMFWHIRFEILNGFDEERVIGGLPEVCEMTRRVEGVGVGSQNWGEADYEDFAWRDAGWHLLRRLSEWAVLFGLAHSHERPIGSGSMAQFLHYLDNMLQTPALRLHMLRHLDWERATDKERTDVYGPPDNLGGDLLPENW